MGILLFGVTLGLGYVWGRWSKAVQKTKEIRLIMQIQLDATQPVKINAVGKDSEGNVISLSGYDLTIEAIATTGEFGTVNDENDTFDPGEAGATGTIRGTVTIDDVPYQAEVEVELVAGGLTEIALAFAPVE